VQNQHPAAGWTHRRAALLDQPLEGTAARTGLVMEDRERFKQSGLGREMGVFGLEAHQPKTVLGRNRPEAGNLEPLAERNA
jgi:hypothetical protein